MRQPHDNQLLTLSFKHGVLQNRSFRVLALPSLAAAITRYPAVRRLSESRSYARTRVTKAIAQTGLSCANSHYLYRPAMSDIEVGHDNNDSCARLCPQFFSAAQSRCQRRRGHRAGSFRQDVCFRATHREGPTLGDHLDDLRGAVTTAVRRKSVKGFGRNRA